MKIWQKISGKVNLLLNSSEPEICQDVSTWYAARGISPIRLAPPIYQEIRALFTNEEMAVAMVDTHREVLSRSQNLVLLEQARVRETLGLVELHDGSVLMEGNWWEPLLRQHPTYRKRIGFLKHKLRGDVFSLLAMWSTSFYHWFHDVLPRLEASAPKVLAPHGAGLTNIMFCHQGTAIGEVHYAETVYNDHYWMLAQHLIFIIPTWVLKRLTCRMESMI